VTNRLKFLASALILAALTGACCAVGMHLAPAAMAASSETTMVDVPLELALKEVRGDGRRRMIVFEDPLPLL
jgi:hypothetical protein